MKALLCVFVCLLFAANIAFSQVPINNQNDFFNRLAAHNWTLHDNAVGLDYVFAPGIYEIEVGWLVEVREQFFDGNNWVGDVDAQGVTIQFSRNSTLVVNGQLFVNADQAIPEDALPLDPIQRPQFIGEMVNGMPIGWNGIQINRPIFGMAGGLGVFCSTDIIGGADREDNNWQPNGTEAQITVNNHACLYMRDCVLTQSRLNSIYAWTFSSEMIFYGVSITNTENHGGVPRVQGHGLFIQTDPPLIPPFEPFPRIRFESDLGNPSEISFCNYGFYSLEINNDTPRSFFLGFTESEVHDNYDTGIRIQNDNPNSCDRPDVVIDNSRIYNNGWANLEVEFPEGVGWGININNIHQTHIRGDEIWLPPASLLHIINNSEIFNNGWGGVRAWDVIMGIKVEDSQIRDNAVNPALNDQQNFGNGMVNFTRGQGLKVRLWRMNDWVEYFPADGPGVQSYLHVYRSEIFGNGFEGISVSKGRDDDVNPENPAANPLAAHGERVYIMGNHIHNNGVNLLGALHDERDARRGANVHILETLHHVIVSHNLIETGETGLCVDVTSDLEENEERPCDGLLVRNNTIRDNRMLGLFWRRNHNWDIEDAARKCFVIFNAIWDNGRQPAPIAFRHGNVRIRETVDDWIMETQFQNNIIGTSNDWNGPDVAGVIIDWAQQPDQWPGFSHNAFAGNPGGHRVNIVGAPIVGQANVTLDVANHNDLGIVQASSAIAGNDDDDFRLRWHSPLINRARFEPALNDDPTDPGDANWSFAEFVLRDYDNPTGEPEIVRDGSRGDIGLYGGSWAGGVQLDWFDFWVRQAWPPGDQNLGPDLEELGNFGLEAHCLIDDAFDDLSNDNFLINDPQNDFFRAFLEWDHYQSTAWTSVPNGETFTIGGQEPWENEWQNNLQYTTRNVYIEIGDDNWFDVYGTLEVVGEPSQALIWPEQVTFTSIPGEIFEGMWFWNVDAGTELTSFECSNSYNGVHFYGNENGGGAERIILDRFKIHDHSSWGVYISDTYITLDTDLMNIIDDDLVDERSKINENESVSAGVYIGSCPDIGIFERQVEIRDVNIENNGEANQQQTIVGVKIVESTGVDFDNVSVLENEEVGIYVVGCNPAIDGSDNEFANDIQHNGQGVGIPGGIEGSEIYVDNNSFPSFNFCDIFDTHINNPCLLVWRDIGAVWLPIDFENCFWFDLLEGPAPDPPIIDAERLAWFRPEVPTREQFLQWICDTEP